MPLQVVALRVQMPWFAAPLLRFVAICLLICCTFRIPLNPAWADRQIKRVGDIISRHVSVRLA